MKMKDSTLKQLMSSKPLLPPRQVLLDLINECVFLLAGLSLGKLKLDRIEDQIHEVCRKSFLIDKEVETPEAKELLKKEEKSFINHFINAVDTNGFEDMIDSYSKHLKEDKGVPDEVIVKVRDGLYKKRIIDVDAQNKGEA